MQNKNSKIVLVSTIVRLVKQIAKENPIRSNKYYLLSYPLHK
jgi:hypothetical protein